MIGLQLFYNTNLSLQSFLPANFCFINFIDYVESRIIKNDLKLLLSAYKSKNFIENPNLKFLYNSAFKVRDSCFEV